MGSDNGDAVCVLSSDSSEDYYLDQYVARSSAKKRGRATPSSNVGVSTPAARPKTDDEPEWVKNYTPAGEQDSDRKAALIAALLDDEDDDSFVDLVPESGEEKASREDKKDIKSEAEEVNKKESTSVAKRARAIHKPKSTLPLTVAPKLLDGLVLVQGSGDGLDLSGDIGAVGRVKLEEGKCFLDIKGVVYRANSHPCNSVCVVSVGDDEAKIVSVMDEAVKLTCERNLFASDEIMIHGDLDEEVEVNGAGSEMEVSPEARKEVKKGKQGDLKGKSKAGAKGRGGGGVKKSIGKQSRKGK